MNTKSNTVEKTYTLLKYSIPILAKFPRNQKYLLGDRMENGMLEVLELFVQAYYTKKGKKLSFYFRPI